MGESSQLPARKTEKSAEQPTKTLGISPSMLGGNPNIHKHHEKRNREKRNEIPIAL